MVRLSRHLFEVSNIFRPSTQRYTPTESAGEGNVSITFLRVDKKSTLQMKEKVLQETSLCVFIKYLGVLLSPFYSKPYFIRLF